MVELENALIKINQLGIRGPRNKLMRFYLESRINKKSQMTDKQN